MSNLDKYGQLTKNFEGFRDKPYKDTEGVSTIGYGFNLEDESVSSLISEDVKLGKQPLSREKADEIFPILYERAENDAKKFLGEEEYINLDGVRQGILTDMAYNLGLPKLSKFVKMKEALKEGDFKEASREMVDSKWFTQVGDRAKSHVKSMAGETIEDEEGVEVKEIQQRLNDLGYDSGKVDGIMGKRTKGAIKEYQKDKGLKVDGVAGTNTKRSLFDELSRLNPFQVSEASAMELPTQSGGMFGMDVAPDEDLNKSQILDVDEAVRKRVDEQLAGMADKVNQSGGVDPTLTKAIELASNVGEKVLAVDKGIMSFVAAAPSHIGALVKNFGENLEENPEFWISALSVVPIPEQARVALADSVFGDMLTAPFKKTQIDERVADLGQQAIEANRRFMESKNLTGAEFEGIDRVLFDIGSGTASLGASIGVSLITKNPNAAGALFGAIQKASIYQEAREHGLSVRAADLKSTKAGVLEGAIEAVTMNWFLKKYGGKVATTIIRMSDNFLQEGAQQLSEELIADWRGQTGMQIAKNVGYAAFLGLIVSGGASLALDIAERNGMIDKLEQSGLDRDSAKRMVGKLIIAQRQGLGEVIRAGIDQAKELKGEKGLYGGEKATGYEEAEGKFSSLTDKKERFEISDKDAKFDMMEFDQMIGDKLEGRNIQTWLPLILKHDELYRQYPKARNIKVTFTEPEANFKGGYDSEDNTISLNQEKLEDSDELKSVILHEIQHAIQEKEGFARGGNPQEFIKPRIEIEQDKEFYAYGDYKRLAGEVEARDVSQRKDLTPEQRRATQPLASQGIALKDMIVKGGGDVAESREINDFYKQIKGTKKGEKIEIKDFKAYELPPNIQKAIESNSAEVYISSKAIKHIDEQRSSLAEYFFTDIARLLNTEEIYKNYKKGVEDSYLFIKRNGNNYATVIEVKNVDGRNEIATIMPIRTESIKKLEPLRVQVESGKTALSQSSFLPSGSAEAESISSFENPLPASGFSALQTTLNIEQDLKNVKDEEILDDFLVADNPLTTDESELMMSLSDGNENVNPHKENFQRALPENDRTQEAMEEWEKAQREWEQDITPPEKPPTTPPVAGGMEEGKEPKKGLTKGKVKPIVNLMTGVRKIQDLITMREDVALRQQIRAESKASKRGFSAGKALIREQNRIKRLTEQLVKSINYWANRNMNFEYKEQIDEIMGRLDLKKRAEKTLARRENLKDFIERQKALGESVYINPEMIAMLDKVTLNDLSLEKLKDIQSTIKALAHLGIIKDKLLANKRSREYEQIVSDIAGQIRETTGNELVMNDANELDKKIMEREGIVVRKGKARKLTKPEMAVRQTVEKVRNFRSELRKVKFIARVLDGFKYGALQKNITQPIDDAFSKSQTKIADIFMLIDNKLQPIKKELLKNINKTNTVEGFSFTKPQAMAVYANSFSPINYEFGLVKGHKWSPEKIQGIIDTLSGQEKRFVRDMMEIVDSLYTETAGITEQLTGQRMYKRKGYFPKVTDKELSDLATLREAEKNLFQDVMKVAFVERGFTKPIGKLAEPVSLDFFGVLFNHLNKVIHFNTHALAVRDVQKLIRDPRIKSMVTQNLGQRMYQQFPSWLTDVANPHTIPQNSFDKFFGWLKRNSTTAILGLKVGVSLKQFGSITLTFNELGVKNTLRYMKEFYNHPIKNLKFIYDNSSQMKFREKSFDRDVREWIQSAQAKKMFKNDSGMQQMFYWMIKTMDKIATLPTWYAAYEVEMGKSGDHDLAVDVADGVVARTQPAGAVKDLPTIMRGSDTQKIFTMFYTHFSNSYNQLADIGGKMKYGQGNIPKKAIEALVSLWWVLMMGSYYGSVMTKGMKRANKDFVKDVASYGFASMPLVREVASATINKKFGYSASPVFGAGESVAKMLTSKKPKTRLKGLTETIGYVSGLPTPQAWITVTGLLDIANGKTNDVRRLFISEYYLNDEKKEIPNLRRIRSPRNRLKRKRLSLR